jgi:mannonate dehydratase
MRIALVLTPFTDYNLRLASQIGVTDVVIRYPGQEYLKLINLKTEIEGYGMRLSVVEGYLPIENTKLGTAERDVEIEYVKTLIRNMGQAGVPLLCYNFMAGSDWSRTSFKEIGRGGAWVSSFDASLLGPAEPQIKISEEQLWENLEYFLKQVVPIAEAAGVILAMHPDDPPLPSLHGFPRIMHNVENIERLTRLVLSPCNAICFCQGTFAEMGVDIPATIKRLGADIRYVHFRDVIGTAAKFIETFHDNGQTNMYQAMCAYRDIGFSGPMRPDHVPQLVGEEDGEPGYTMLGRLFAVGYMRALIEAAQEESSRG